MSVRELCVGLMATYLPFNTAFRVDELPRSWEFSIQNRYEDVDGLTDIAEELFGIPVKPLPDPLVPGNEEWHASMNISDYEFADTWGQYLDVLREHGSICHSEFEYRRLPEDEQPAPPRPQCAVTIETKLPRMVQGRKLYFMATIYATGRVECLAMDEERYRELFE